MPKKPETGAENLLLNCAQAQRGERLLIAYEPARHGYFDAQVLPCVQRVARRLRLQVDLVDVGFDPEGQQLPEALVTRMGQADIVLFLARLGDQLRFSDLPPGRRYVVSFAVTEELLGSGFATARYQAFDTLQAQIQSLLHQATHIEMTCPNGTRVSGKWMGPPETGDTTMRRFPMSVHPAVPASGFSGRIAVPGFFCGTGSRYYDPYTVEFTGPLLVLFDQGRITGFEGSRRDVARARTQFDRISGRYRIDRDAVHSWHAGIHPGCGYPWDVSDNFERWGGCAFGNPRVLHFHACGNYAPGEICLNVIDPTIRVDGVAIWENGTLCLSRIPGAKALLEAYPCARAAFDQPDLQIGFRQPA